MSLLPQVPVASNPLGTYDKLFVGLVLPVERRQSGFFQPAYTRDLIKASLRMILETRQGERVFQPTFGSRLHRLQFEPNAAFVSQLAKKYVIEDVVKWEPRVQVTDVTTTLNEEVIEISVSYAIRTLSIEDVLTLFLRRGAT